MLHLLAAAPPPSVNATIVVTLAVSAICGWVIPIVTDLVTKWNAPTVLKTLIASGLATLAGVLSTVVFTPNEHWQDYLLAIGVAFVNTQAAHRTLKGLGDPVQKKFGNVGLGETRYRGHVGAGDDGQVLLVVILVVLALILFGFGFTVKWLFILAVIAILAAIFLGFSHRR